MAMLPQNLRPMMALMRMFLDFLPNGVTNDFEFALNKADKSVSFYVPDSMKDEYEANLADWGDDVYTPYLHDCTDFVEHTLDQIGLRNDLDFPELPDDWMDFDYLSVCYEGGKE